jgi:hypothetical protein
VEEAPVYYHEGGDLIAEDLERNLAVLPEVTIATEEVKREDIQIGDPDHNSPERSRGCYPSSGNGGTYSSVKATRYLPRQMALCAIST